MPDPSFLLPLLWQSAMAPFAAAMVALIVLRRTPPAILIGFLACFAAVFHATWSPVPKQSLDWLPWILIATALLARASDIVSHGIARALIRLATAMGAAAVTALPAMASGAIAAPYLPVLAAGFLMFVAWTYTARASRSRDTPAVLLAMIGGGAALVMMLDASQLLGQLAGGLASSLAACVVLALIRRGQGRLSEAACGIAVIALGVLMMNAYVYAGLSALYLTLLCAGLLADAANEMIDRLRGGVRGAGALITAVLLAVVPLAAAVGFAVKAMQDSGY